jgi:two-component system, cell cycle sensor histidine kinase and response regulator CckA
VQVEGPVEFDTKLRHKDGSLLHVSNAVSAVRSPSGEVTGLAIIMRNATKVRALERRLQSLGQLEALARVAAGFAHDINNVLTVAGTYQGFVADEPLSPGQATDLKVASEAVERGAAVVDQLLALGRNGPTPVTRVDLNDVARNIEEVMRRSLGDRVVLSIRAAPSPTLVIAAAGQLDQVLLALALNARDAMPGGGQLSIAVRNASVGAAHPLAGELAHGTYAVLSVKDTGSGIDQETLTRIFEPFFSTKPLGEGTGLGLFIVKDMIAQLRGALRVETCVGQGSEFQIYLPLAEPQPHFESIAPDPEETDKQTILVVDEDVALRRGLQRILRAAGYSVLVAADGFDASDIAARYAGAIDLLICDLHMSREDGRHTMARLRATRPELATLFVSGQPVKRGFLEAGAQVMRKPFTAQSLTRMVEEVLSQPRTRRPGPLPERPVVLLVDDDPEFRESLLRLLGESDLLLMSAKSGLHAVQVLEEQHVDLVVADQMMPGMDGVRLLELIRDRWPSCQRVLLTGQASSDVVLGAVNRGGVSKVLTKSMHPLAIRDEIERASFGVARFCTPGG